MRVVAVAGRLALGRTLPGRGAWLCRGSRPCFVLAVRKGALGRALHTSVTPEAAGALGRALDRLDQDRSVVWEDIRPRSEGVDMTIGKD